MEPPPPSRTYAAVRALGRFWVWFLFKTVQARHRERVPAAGPVLLCMNHPNNLIDSILIGVTVPRQVHFLATATLFRRPWLARFLHACGVIPVYRRQDDPERTDRNAEAFAACLKALRQGRLVGIYPEGATHAESRIRAIKTGAARLALMHEATRAGDPQPGAPLVVVPVGLTFEARKSFRGRVVIGFGEPIAVTAHVAAFGHDPAAAVDALTRAIQARMEAEVLHLPRPDTAEIVRAVEALYQEDLVRQLEAERGVAPEAVDRLRLQRSIADAIGHFRDREPGRVERLWQRIRSYQDLLAEYRVRDRAVSTRLDQMPARHSFRRSGRALAGLPVFAYGAVVNALPYLLPRAIARRLARRETDYATVRILASMVAFPLCWGIETWVVWRTAGALWALAFLASLPLTGLVAYHYLCGLGRLGSQVRFGVLALLRRQAASRLLDERRRIHAELERAKTDYLAETRGERG
jgi:1-acyl-sn-glycerol-3-phosphate acyltransferase